MTQEIRSSATLQSLAWITAIHTLSLSLSLSLTRTTKQDSHQRRLVGGAIGGWAHCNGWNGINGSDLNMWFPYVWYRTMIPFQPVQWTRPSIAPTTSLHWLPYITPRYTPHPKSKPPTLTITKMLENSQLSTVSTWDLVVTNAASLRHV